jgi:hypothetical protein
MVSCECEGKYVRGVLVGYVRCGVKKRGRSETKLIWLAVAFVCLIQYKTDFNLFLNLIFTVNSLV